MTDDNLNVGWKAATVVAIVIGLVAAAAALRPPSEDPRIHAYDERIRELEKQIAVLKVTGGGPNARAPKSDMSIGE